MTNFPSDAKTELRDIDTFEVSLVDRAANRWKFLLVKSEGTPEPAVTLGEDHALRPALLKAAQDVALILDGRPHQVRNATQRVALDLLAACGHEVTEGVATPPALEPAVKTEPVVPTAPVVQVEPVVAPVTQAETVVVETPTEDAVQAIIEAALKSHEPQVDVDAIQAIIHRAQGEAATQQVDILRRDLDVVRAELEAQRVIAAHELVTSIAEARAEAVQATESAYAVERATMQAQLTAMTKERDDALAKAAALTTDLAKAKDTIQQSSAMHNAVALVERLTKKSGKTAPSQVITPGETPSSPGHDPWDFGNG